MKLIFDKATNLVTIVPVHSAILKDVREASFPRMFATQLVFDLGFSTTVRNAITKDIRAILNSEDTFEDGLTAMAEADMITLTY